MDREYNSNVSLLERPSDITRDIVKDDAEVEQARTRMRDNLDRLLHYEEYDNVKDSIAGQQSEEIEVEKAQVSEEVSEEKSQVAEPTSEDARPTSTTMQFGDADINQMYNEMQEEEKNSYKLNTKGKIAIILYSIAIVIIMALIVLNTGVLNAVKIANEEKTVELNNAMHEFSQTIEELNEVSKDSNVMTKAEDFGMIIGD